MSIEKNKIKINDELGRTINIGFTYTEKGKTYEGVLTLMTTNTGGMAIEDYDIIWDESPENYDPDVDNKKVYEAYLSTLK